MKHLKKFNEIKASDFNEGFDKEVKKKKKKKDKEEKGVKAKDFREHPVKKNESVVHATYEEQLDYYKRIKRTHFGKRPDRAEDATTAHTTTKFYNDLTRKWEDVSFDEINDRIKALEDLLDK